MRKTLKSVGAAALAAATVVSGLSFGSAAAVAAPEPKAKSAKAGTMASPLEGAFTMWQAPNDRRNWVSWKYRAAHSDIDIMSLGYDGRPQPGERFSFPAIGSTGPIKHLATNLCLRNEPNFANVWLSSCSATDRQTWSVQDDGTVKLASWSTYLRYGGGSNPGLEAVSGHQYATPLVMDFLTPPVSNGGVGANGIGFPATIPATERRTVHFGASANATVTSMTNTTITVDAPAGSRFAAGQTSLTGEYKPAGGSWASSNSLTMTGTVNAAGTRFTGRMATPGSGFALHDGHQIRWGIDVVAGSTAGTQNMAFSGAGTTNHGTFSFSGNSAVTVTEAATTPLKAEVLSIDHAKKEATLMGSATPGAEIKVNGEVIATANDAGAWVGKVSGLSAGSNSVLVEQFVGSKKIDDQRLTIVVVENGGFLAAGVGHATTITQGEEGTVAFGMRADKATTLEGTTRVTATAPAGTTFPSGLTKLSGAYKVAGGSWVTTPALDVTGTVTADGRTFTGTTTAGTAFAADSEARWTGKLAAAKDAAVGTRNLGFAVTGATTHGSFSVEGNSKITIEKNDSVDLTARGAFDEDVTKLATISGAAQSGATVKLYDADGKVIATTTANGENQYSFDVPTPQSGGKHQFTVTQTPSGAAESAPVAVELDYGQNTGLDVTSPEDGSTINDVRPTFTGTGTNGATIELREAGVLVATTTVKDGAWSVTASSNLGYAKHDVVVTQITKGDLRTQQNLSFTIEKAQEESPLTAKVDSVDDVARSAAISGHATPGAQIQRDGKVIATADATTGAWSATVTDLKVGQNPVTLDQFVGGVKKDSKTLDIEVKQTQFPFAVTSPENDSVVRTSDKQVTFTGTGKPGAKVSVNYGPRNIGTAFVNNDGEWKFTATMNYADYELTVFYKQNPTGPVTSQQPLHITVTNNEQNNPFVVTAPANDAVIPAPDKQVTFEGTGTTGGIVTIKHGAKTVGTGTVNDNGQWKFTSTMNYADYDLTAYYKKTPTSGAVQQKLHIVVTDGAVVKPFEVTTPSDGSTVETADKQVTFSGEGAGNGLVKILRGSRVVAEGTVGTNGQWTLTGELNYGSYDVTVFHKPVGSKTADSKVLNLTIAPPAKDFEISTPSNGATVPGGPITFTGTGKDGGLVSAFLNSKKRAEGTVQNNTWTMTTAAITTPGTHTFTIYYKANPASQIADAYPITITIK